jgi:type I restriction enzyme R subunit
MASTDLNSEDRLVQQTIAGHLEDVLGWDSVYAWNDETFGPNRTLGRNAKREAVLTHDLCAAMVLLNSTLPDKAIDKVVTAGAWTRLPPRPRPI